MILDAITLRNLEILNPLRGDRNDTTLFGFLNRTKTPMGSRVLRSTITRPLTSPEKINYRLDAVEFFTQRPVLLSGVRTILSRFTDIERIAGRIAYGNASPRDLLALASSLNAVPGLTAELCGAEGLLKDELEHIPSFAGIADLILSAIVDEPPLVYKNGGVIREGYSSDLDEIRHIVANGRDWIAELQQTERERTGIRSLKIAYNNVFGYYIEITKANLHLVPDTYERKQTTANGERFTIPALREREAVMAQADDRVLALEISLFESLLTHLGQFVPALQQASSSIGTIDMTAAFADLSLSGNYVRPELVPGTELLIRDGRHPIVENTVPGGYVPNDTEMSSIGQQILILTGANMAGKSTYIRQTALLVLMAQMGSFIPAESAEIGLVDRIFTRVGAADDIARGQSTFMVEMVETANILNHATDRSLVILDEIGRGTSTFDGLSIAWAVAEFLHDAPGSRARTQFATHYHELTELALSKKGVKNYNVAVKEYGDQIIFLRQIVPGGTDKSYGIHVAKLAGLPQSVIERSNEILENLENSALSRKTGKPLLAEKRHRRQDRICEKRGEYKTDNEPEQIQPTLF